MAGARSRHSHIPEGLWVLSGWAGGLAAVASKSEETQREPGGVLRGSACSSRPQREKWVKGGLRRAGGRAQVTSVTGQYMISELPQRENLTHFYKHIRRVRDSVQLTRPLQSSLPVSPWSLICKRRMTLVIT